MCDYTVYKSAVGGDIDVADQVYLYTFFILFIFPFSDPVLRWGVIWTSFFPLFFISSAQPVLVDKETIERIVALFSQEVGKRKLCCSNSLAISLVGQDVLNISVLRA